MSHSMQATQGGATDIGRQWARLNAAKLEAEALAAEIQPLLPVVAHFYQLQKRLLAAVEDIKLLKDEILPGSGAEASNVVAFRRELAREAPGRCSEL